MEQTKHKAMITARQAKEIASSQVRPTLFDEIEKMSRFGHMQMAAFNLSEAERTELMSLGFSVKEEGNVGISNTPVHEISWA